MADRGKMDEKKCAHQNCTCVVAGERRYCSDDCERQADTSPTSVCLCAHPGCQGG
jgi:hypothetical protein